MPSRFVLRSAAVVLLLACARESGSDTARDTALTRSSPPEQAADLPLPAEPAPLDSLGGSFIAWAVEQLALADSAVSLERWRAKFPRDSISRFSRRDTRRYPNHGSDEFPLGAWCARATARARFGTGPTALRRVYFYAASLRPSATLPAPEDAWRLMATECRVGLVFIQLPEPDQERGRGLAWVLRRDMRERFGEGAAPADPSFAFTAPRGSAWLVGSRGHGTSYLEFSSGTNGEAEDGQHDTPWEAWRGVVAVAYRSHPSIGDARIGRLDDEDNTPSRDAAAMLRLAIEASGLDEAAAAPLRALFASLHVAETPAENQAGFALDSFAPLGPWLAASGGLPPERQAGGLFAADVVMSVASRRRLLPSDSVARARFEALGAALAPHPLEKRYRYADPLRGRAYDLHPSGELGDTLFAMIVRDAPPCADVTWIAAEAERHAAASRGARRGEAHLVAARALADAYVKTGSGELKQRAIEHYQAAVTASQFDHDGQQRAWEEGWRLAVGLAPLRLRYYCSAPN